MNPEQLAALLADHALGELKPEVRALLDAYLAQNPAAAAHAAAVDNALRLARAAVATPRENPANLDLNRLRRTRETARVFTRSTNLLRLAASLAVGVGLGWWLRPEAPAPLPPSPVARLAPPHTPVAITHFWSVTRFAPDSVSPQPKKSL